MPSGSHTILLSLEGGLLAFGANYEGQLGLDHKKHHSQPEKVSWNGPKPVQVDCGGSHSLVLDVEGGVWDAGSSRAIYSSPTFELIPDLPRMAVIAAGGGFSAAIDTEGGLWVWTSYANLSWASSLPRRVEGLPPIMWKTVPKGLFDA